VFIKSNELAKGLGKVNFLGRGEGIGAKLVLETGDENREAQGIEARIGEDEIVPQRGDLFFLFGGDVFNLRKYC
jgi:hypothetical protein